MPVKTKPVTSNGTAKKGKAITPTNGNADKEIKKLIGNTSLDERLIRFEELKGLNSKRDYVTRTLTEVQKFNFGTNGSSSLILQDETGHQFSTSNTNLITMLAENLQERLESKKKELEEKIMTFEF